MLTGRRAFRGETVSDTLVSILEREPEWTSLPSSTPAPVRRLLVRCLEKDPRRRLHDIADARIDIEDTLSGHAPQTRKAVIAALTSPGRAGWYVAGGLLLALVAAAPLLWRVVARNPSPADASDGVAAAATFRQLTAAPGIEWFPSISPDGTWVVYGGDAAGNRDIYLQSATGQTAINLTVDSLADDDEPVFSPDGERIAFRSARDGGGIFVMGRTGEAVKRVTRMGFHPTWSPDGGQLAFTTEDIDINPQNGRGPSALWVVNVDSGEQRSLNAPAAILASWSPHGTRIAYSIRATTGDEEIWTLPATGGPPVLVASGAVDAFWNPSWSPDGRFLYFSSDRSGSMNLWRVPIDEPSGRTLGNPQPLATPASFAAHASISSDGRRIVYSSVQITTNIQRLSLDPLTGSVKGESGWVTTGSRAWANPDPSPDGQWVTFYSRLQPEGDIYVARADGTGLRQVIGDAALDRVPRWSPDGNWIAFFSNRNGRYQLWKIRPDGSDLGQMTDVEGGGMYTAWSPANASIATTPAPSGANQTASSFIFDTTRPWTDQTPRTLPPFEPPNGYFVVNTWSPDGEKIAGSAGLDGKGVVIYSLRSNRYERLTDVGEWPDWFPDSRRILFVAGGKDFFVVDSATTQVRKIYSSMRDVLGPPRLTRDGREAYFSRRVTESDVWLATLP
jgi:Tol biopolymer transport system component